MIFRGYGVHSGLPAQLEIVPAAENHGIVFMRHDENGKSFSFKACIDFVTATELCTCLGVGAVQLRTIEHLMAALYAFHIDNVLIYVTGEELPILDGSSLCYAQAFQRVGLRMQNAPRSYIRIKQKVRVERAGAYAEFSPDYGCLFDVAIEFPYVTIGKQNFTYDLTSSVFAEEVAFARTFGFIKDMESLWVKGVALGSSIENSVILGLDGEVLNPAGLRSGDEFVRHKVLDAIGDIALLGRPFIGQYRSFCSGHALNIGLVAALFANKDSYEIVSAQPGECTESSALRAAPGQRPKEN